jgi:hypothetical protein
MSIASGSHSWVLDELEEDHVGLWGVIDEIRRTLSAEDPERLRQEVLALAQAVLAQPDVRVGVYHGDEFRLWSETGSEAVSRIDREWRALGRDPSINEIGWFSRVQS